MVIGTLNGPRDTGRGRYAVQIVLSSFMTIGRDCCSWIFPSPNV